MKESIKQYIRDKKGHPIGVLIAINDGTAISLGWSLCSKCDTFSKKLGTQIAESRARSSKWTEIPETVCIPMENFKGKCIRYFTSRVGDLL